MLLRIFMLWGSKIETSEMVLQRPINSLLKPSGLHAFGYFSAVRFSAAKPNVRPPTNCIKQQKIKFLADRDDFPIQIFVLLVEPNAP